MHNLLSGNWSFETTVCKDNIETNATGIANIGTAADGELTITGHWYDKDGNPYGDWSANEIILTERKLIFVYSVPAQHGRAPLYGLTNLDIVTDIKLKKTCSLNGFWGVLGLNLHGTTKWVKA